MPASIIYDGHASAELTVTLANGERVVYSIPFMDYMRFSYPDKEVTLRGSDVFCTRYSPETEIKWSGSADDSGEGNHGKVPANKAYRKHVAECPICRGVDEQWCSQSVARCVLGQALVRNAATESKRTNPLALQVKKLDKKAILPTVGYPGEDIGFDLYALEPTVLHRGQVTKVRTGVAASLKGFGFLMRERSSLAVAGVTTSGGTIDAGYTGELLVNMTHNNEQCYLIKAGDKIANLIPVRVETNVAVAEVTELPKSARGAKGYGSTGR